MSKPLMDPDPTGTRRGRTKPVELSLTTPVRTARAVLAASGTDAAVVLDRHRPVGVVTAAALARHDAETPIGEIMNMELVTVEPGTGERATLAAYQDAAWRSLRRRHPHGE